MGRECFRAEGGLMGGKISLDLFHCILNPVPGLQGLRTVAQMSASYIVGGDLSSPIGQAWILFVTRGEISPLPISQLVLDSA